MKNLFFLLLVIVSFSIEAQIVNIPDANFKAKLLESDTDNFTAWNLSGNRFKVDANNDGEIQESEALQVSELKVISSSISNLTGIESFINLTSLNCSYNQITSLNFENNVDLTYLDCSFNSLLDLDVSNNINLERLFCQNNNISNLNVNNSVNLNFLNCADNNLSTIDVSDNINLSNLNCENNNLTDLDVSNSTNLNVLYCFNNNISTLNINNTNIYRLDCYNNNITALDISSNTNLYRLACQNNQLISLNIKNGNTMDFEDSFYFDSTNNPNLQFVCADENEIDALNTYFTNNGMVVNVNSNCSFLPGGNFNIITGKITYDIQNDGCDVNDSAFPFLKVNIDDGTSTRTMFTTDTGEYNFYTLDGDFTVTPNLENPAFFNVSPIDATINFTDTNNNTTMQDFCITANGAHNDIEIVIIPLQQAIPGLDTEYKIFYKNKGNTTLSGNIDFVFQDDFMDIISANPTFDSQNVNALTWNYTDLLPFERREITLTANLNTPTDLDFPLNSDDVLIFDATINPVMNDETELDNTFTFNQTVVNSFDPNDKTCIEGKTISEEKVGEYVHYLIRFENNGTANATNIVVKDIIDQNMFDISSLIPIHASHNFITRIKDTNVVEFIFENINLPFDDVNNDGYITFKIKTLNTLTIGNSFENSAEIYFDFNFPIITNNEVTTIENALSVVDFDFDDASIAIYPNPVINTMTIKSENTFNKISIYSINGHLIKEIDLLSDKTEINLDLNKLNSGVYFIKTKSLSKSETHKFIKQ